MLEQLALAPFVTGWAGWDHKVWHEIYHIYVEFDLSCMILHDDNRKSKHSAKWTANAFTNTISTGVRFMNAWQTITGFARKVLQVVCLIMWCDAAILHSAGSKGFWECWNVWKWSTWGCVSSITGSRQRHKRTRLGRSSGYACARWLVLRLCIPPCMWESVIRGGATCSLYVAA